MTYAFGVIASEATAERSQPEAGHPLGGNPVVIYRIIINGIAEPVPSIPEGVVSTLPRNDTKRVSPKTFKLSYERQDDNQTKSPD
ncbi:MAG: hypothetical protein A3H70_04740 [Candidatus Komeilibacteria bacterium RIFCSPLOWO2_02_FULL_48_11]|uniref:Uncharacterized protein n=1 Tax=Candidatus Komeilibacteria bacterium RIFCSPLOWO2_02_FULL_48_11 TaxID=1798553 RepID=A0A1G2BTB6_9BACT|nr:MAG: hypothetical protein A3H70_04740 [Candidatus Komeilibacteria bacterium RIFCSPLOWO2_02_FULL_48_11]